MINSIPITDAGDLRLADYVALREVNLRKSLESAEGLFIAEGEKVIRRAVEAGYRPRSFLLAERWLASLRDVLVRCPDTPVYLATEEVTEQVTGFHVHRGALASLHRQPPRPVEDVLGRRRPRRSRIAVLENLVDHANVGSAFRNAAALGVDAVLVTPSCADPLYRRAIKTSMGNVFNVPWTRTPPMPDLLDLLRAHGYTTVALTLADDSITLDELAERDLPALALIFGTEGAGVDPRTARDVDLRVRIPMAAGVDSLNVAAATAVVFYVTR
ncbi:TrmH family RNA methyltransferase [Microlunatus parietis]|uniref:tRNA G18 (Ribose-2'-O)-methylase SpoU n=1 Tax=Microlunatus parietis TaxID=682979 RepID=A0A7Y9LFJ0_9ACTN|nr:RNA methyltransferase [Microlunatus parietis]NYE74176.1 tRNA G18 (ribose-2'-O)-methylase SpoU [Microlunatus parietis]